MKKFIVLFVTSLLLMLSAPAQASDEERPEPNPEPTPCEIMRVAAETIVVDQAREIARLGVVLDEMHSSYAWQAHRAEKAERKVIRKNALIALLRAKVAKARS